MKNMMSIFPRRRSLGKGGIEKRIDMKLTAEEEEKLAASAAIIKEAIGTVLPPELY